MNGRDAPLQGKLDIVAEAKKGTVGSALMRIHEAASSLTAKEIGDWFELVVLRLLLAEPEFEVAEAWLVGECPPDIGGGQDLGTDIVARLTDGRIGAIQCKYRSSGMVSKGDIDSFIADAAGTSTCNIMFVATNTELSRQAKAAMSKPDKSCRHIDVRKHASTSLDDGRRLEPRRPKPHQAKAIERVLAGIGKDGMQERGKLVMACGTGKTFTSLRIAEGIGGAPLILFAAPSIALVGQARREWLNHAARPMATLVVCSAKAEGRAPTRKTGPVDIDPSELACEVTTDPAAIAGFMREGGMPRAVFCTYHSLHCVAEAQANCDAPAFDLAIADEAHRTTGKFDGKKTDFRLILKPDIQAAKRLFMTATPRVYTKDSKSAVDFRVVDMNDEALYGKTLHTLSFREAVKADLLSDYRVIVLALNNRMKLTDEVRRAFKEAQDVGDNADGDDGKADDGIPAADQVRLFGTCLAINGAVQGETVETPKSLPRTLAFANDIKTSKWMAKSISDRRTRRLAAVRIGAEGGKARKAQAVHLDAGTSAAKRLREVHALQSADDGDCRMICNVGLFGEGVDIPALDGVVFFHPRRSPIQVMQAVGRVMRKAPGKKMGYVIVPVMVPPMTNVIEALRNSDEGWEKIGEVLRALQSQDPDLVDNIVDYVHIVQPEPPIHCTCGECEQCKARKPGEQAAFKFDLSEAADKGGSSLYAYIGRAAGFGNRKDLVANHMRDAVNLCQVKMAGMGLAAGMAQALGLPHGTAEERENAGAIASLLLINAMLLSHRLGGDIEGVGDVVERVQVERSPYQPLRHAWLRILRKDYAPIFRPALAVLDVIGSGDAGAQLIHGIAAAALDVAGSISDFSYDHSGPLFHKVLGKRGEADGAFYSNNLAALLLAGLAIPKHSEHPLRVIDPACGTGTLLMAALDTMKRHALHEHPGLAKEEQAELHRSLVENSIHGLDINHHAAQFAAANLTLGAPDVGFSRMNLSAVRDGVHDGAAYAGSLELLPKGAQASLIGVGDIAAHLPPIEGLPDARGSDIFDHRNMDVVITNPPYTEVNNRLKKLPNPADKALMGERFKTLKADLVSADASAEDVLKGSRSLGSFFMPLAKYLLREDDGKLAMVRPVTAMTSPSAQAVAERRYLSKHFHLECAVTSHAPTNGEGLGINFSHDTDVHEALLVLRRWPEGKPRPPTKCVALTRQPDSPAEALQLLDAIQTGKDIEAWGRMTEWPAGRVAAGDWSFANWLDADLAEWALKVRALDGLADLGEHVTVIGRNPNFSKAFRKAESGETPDVLVYDTVSGGAMRAMRNKPTGAAMIRDDAPADVLKAANRPARAFMSFRARPGVSRVLAVHAPNPAVATAYHGLVANTADKRYECALVAFLNSTMAWLQALNQRAFSMSYTRLDAVSVKRLRVPKPHTEAIAPLADAFQELMSKELAQGRDSSHCPVRTRLDMLVAKAVGFDEPTLHRLRRRIAAEPTIGGNG